MQITINKILNHLFVIIFLSCVIGIKIYLQYNTISVEEIIFLFLAVFGAGLFSLVFVREVDTYEDDENDENDEKN